MEKGTTKNSRPDFFNKFPKQDFLYFFYLGFYFVKYGYQPFTAHELVTDLLLLSLFILCFIYSYKFNKLKSLFLIFMLGIAVFSILNKNYGSTVLFVFFAVAACENLKKLPYIISLAILIAILLILNLYFSISIFWITFTFFILFIVLMRIYYEKERSKHRAEIKKQSLVEVQLIERNRISADLHDALGVKLSTAVLLSQLGYRQSNDNHREKLFRQLEDLSRDSLDQIRLVINNSQNISFHDEIEKLRKVLLLANIDAIIDVKCEKIYSENHRKNLVYIINEVVTNMVKHSDGKKCRISLLPKGQKVNLIIKCEGSVHIDSTKGNGIKNIKSRAQEMNGNLQISTVNGFKLELDFKP